ncbi:MAG: hypothetical protein ABR498_04410 [Candidatus Dormibacteria bacterium]
MLAHILPSSIVPEAAQWVVIALAAVGAVGFLRRRGRLYNCVAWSMFGVGTAGIVVMVGIGLFSPQPPGYALSFASAPSGASPLQLTVCARYPNGAPARTPQNGDVLAATVDANPVGYYVSNNIVVPVPAGHHTLRVELLTSEHRQFNPPVAVQATVSTATSGARVAAAFACPGS